MPNPETFEVYSKYQIYFNDQFTKRELEYYLEDDVDDKDINYMIKLDCINSISELVKVNVLVYINVLNNELTFFAVLEQDETISFDTRLQMANNLNTKLSYGKIYSLDQYTSYMYKTQLPKNIAFFEEDVIDRCLFEIQLSVHEMYKQSGEK